MVENLVVWGMGALDSSRSLGMAVKGGVMTGEEVFGTKGT